MKNNIFNLKVNAKFDHKITLDSLQQMDIVPSGSDSFHLIKDGKSYQGFIKSVDVDTKSVTLVINQEKFEVNIADKYDQLIDKMGLNLIKSHQVNDIKAPMPGLVLSIEIAEGQEVIQGDPLLILEAMKMENVIKSPGSGKVKNIIALQGRPVDKGEILIEME